MSDTEEKAVTRVAEMYKYFKALNLESINPALTMLRDKIESQNSQINELQGRIKSLETNSAAYLSSAGPSTAKDYTKTELTVQNSNLTDAVTVVDKSKSKLLQKMLFEIPICDGKVVKQLITFIIDIDKLVRLKLVSEREYVTWIMTRTSGFLANWWFQQASTENSWDSVKSLMLREIMSPVHIETLKNEMCFRYQYDSETLLEFAHSVDAVAKALNLGWSEEATIQTILSRISPRTYYYLRSNPTDIKSMSQLTQISSEIEGAILRDSLHSQAHIANIRHNYSQRNNYGYFNSRRSHYVSGAEQGSRPEQRIADGGAREQERDGRMIASISHAGRSNSNTRGPRCFECNGYGHFGRDCEQRRMRHGSNSNSVTGNGRRE